jgi:hypothetical protein
VSITEGNSYEFTANGQPGNRYRQVPSSCCFGPGAQVVMADGSLRPIESIAPGERVKTPDGDRAVLLLSTPLRGQRTLYRIDDLRFTFTASHPFLIDGGGSSATGTFAAVDPERLARMVPTLSQYGIRPMGGTPDLRLTSYGEGGTKRYQPRDVHADDSAQPGSLYDLVLEPGDDGRSEYFVGDDARQLLVSSEIPRFMAAPATAAVIVQVLQETAPGILATLDRVPDEGFADILSIGLRGLASTMMAHIGPEFTRSVFGETPVFLGLDAAATAAATGERVEAFARGLVHEDGLTYNDRLGLVLDFFVASFAEQLQAAIRLAWRSFDLADHEGEMLLAVTVYALELFDASTAIAVDDATLTLTLSDGEARYERVQPVLASGSTDQNYYTTDEVSYFPEWRPAVVPPDLATGGTDWTLTIALRARNASEPAPIQGVTSLPRFIVHGYEAMSVPVHDRSGRVCGRAAMDVRTLRPSGRAAELEARARWSPEMELRVAHHLAPLVSQYVSDNFPVAIVAGQKYAVTSAGQEANLPPLTRPPAVRRPVHRSPAGGE